MIDRAKIKTAREVNFELFGLERSLNEVLGCFLVNYTAKDEEMDPWKS